MRNDDSGDATAGPSLSHQIVNCCLHHLLALIIERRRRLVQDENGWIAYQGPCNSDSLLLTTAELSSPGAHLGVELVREGLDKVVSVGSPGSGLDLVIGGRLWPSFASCDVLCDAGVKQQGLLRYHANVVPHRPDVKTFHVVAVNAHPAFLWIVESADKSGDGALSRARLSNEGNRFARGNIEVDIIKDLRSAGRVLEVETLDGDAALHGLYKRARTL
mmetsp:Transcript_7824/g.13801  ORF Transcript_7824/g.13801 Transcript_7824/m.13801 type:complete len:218 (+) Transcript_7824:3438-4091(+)